MPLICSDRQPEKAIAWDVSAKSFRSWDDRGGVGIAEIDVLAEIGEKQKPF